MTESDHVDKTAPHRRTELILSVVTIVYAAMTIATQFPGVQKVLLPVCSAWNFIGLQQRWNLFAPVMPPYTAHLIAIVTLADGAKIIVEPPRPSTHSFLERIIYNRYLKWGADYVIYPAYRPYLPQLCGHILREFQFPENPAKSCTLILEGTQISQPQKSISPRDVVPERWWHAPVYHHEYIEGNSDVRSHQ